ncbi:MAG: peroxiredoxin family protein [Actinomycetota bacterium]
MQQVVDRQNDKRFQALRLAVLSISPDPPEAWAAEGSRLGITTPLLSDPENQVATMYGVMRWKMPSNEPGPHVRAGGRRRTDPVDQGLRGA